MKLTITTIVFLLLFVSLGFARDVRLIWDANTEADLIGYNVYWGLYERSGLDPKLCYYCGYGAKATVLVGTQYTVPNLTNGQPYFFSVTAFDYAGNESVFSNQVADKTPRAFSNPRIIR